MLPALMAITLVAASVDPDSGARPLTLSQAIGMAQSGAPAMIAARGQQRATHSGVRAAYAAYIPSVSLSGSSSRQYSQSRTQNQGGQVVVLSRDPWSYGGGINANLQLFDGGQRIFDVQQAKARERSADAGAVTQSFNTALDVAQNFFASLAAREAVAAAQAQLDQAELLLAESRARLRAKTVTRSDSLRAEIQVRSARLALLQATTDRMSANAALTRAVGSDVPVTAAATDSEFDANLSLDDADVRRLAEESPSIAAARAALEAARAAHRASRTGYLPSLSAGYSRNANGTGEQFWPGGVGYGYTGSLRFTASWPLFNQLQRESEVIQSDVAETNAEASLRDAILGARADITRSLGEFHTARERVESQLASVEAAEEDFHVQQQRYAIGGSTHLDVLASQTTLEQARRDLIRARFDQRLARAQLEAIVGRSL